MEFHLGFADLSKLASGNFGPLYFWVVLLAMPAEALALRARGKTYDWKSAGVSSVIAIGFLLALGATHSLIFSVIAAEVYSVRLKTIPVSWGEWPSLIMLFLLVDLAFYVGHRCSHSIRILWATHSVHHSAEAMVIPATYRLTWTPILGDGFPSYLSIVWLGYDPGWVFGVAAFGLMYQPFLHTELVGRIGWLEWIINTPSAHRVHHATNAEYRHKNFGGTLLIWDRLFGTYEAERPDVQIRYGLTRPRSSDTNPLIIVFEGYWQLLMDFLRAPGWRERIASLLGRP